MNVEKPINLYSTIQKAYDFFNTRLFNDELSDCVITLQRKRNAAGYFSPCRFVGRNGSDDKRDEIALNPSEFVGRDDTDILSTLVHEMAHKHQYEHGKPGRGRYHNREWASIMKGVGLHPSATGLPGGKETGDRMSHYVVEEGLFAGACESFLSDGESINWESIDATPKKRSNSKVKYSCECGQNAWAKPMSFLICGFCQEEMQ